MDITSFIVSSRDKVDQPSDYGRYRTRLATRLLKCRKKLHVATRHRGKYNHKSATIQPEQVAHDITYVHLLILLAERAHAQAVSIKAVQTANGKNTDNHARSHIVSRFDKAAKYAENLQSALQQDASGASMGDRLEARAYAASLRGAANLERRSWQRSLADYAVAWAIYSALASAAASAAGSKTAASADTFRELVTANEPWVRYAAYQLKVPRSTPIPIIVREALSGAETAGADAALVATIDKIDSAVLHPQEASAGDTTTTAMDKVVVASTRTLTWRSRQVRIEDAPIASAWAALDRAKARLEAALLAGGPRMASPSDQAAAYDDVLTASQDAVDVTKAAMDDLRGEGRPQSDPAVQTLYMARTAANYEMISYRIGRHRVLTGAHDGATVQLQHALKNKHRNTKRTGVKKPATRPEAPGRFVARLKEKVVLYDGILQSLDSVKELPGVANDAELSQQLDATIQYFTALKSLAIARSHYIAGNADNALALVKHAHDQCSLAAPVLGRIDSALAATTETPSPLRTIHVSGVDAAFLLRILESEVQRGRALVDISRLQQPSRSSPDAAASPTGFLSERLAYYPQANLDLAHIVAYPPRLEPVPVKPLFLDIAWNYIDYPNKSAASGGATTTKAGQAASTPTSSQAQQSQETKRGWFGFGR